MRYCPRDKRPVLDEHGNPDYSRFFCRPECSKEDRREKLAAKRAKVRAGIEHLIQAELKRRCNKCPNKESQ
jgi:hypothetical protein